MKSTLSLSRAVSVIGSGAGMAVSSFVLSLLLINGAPIEDYGFFAFLLVVQAFSNAVANALVGSPLLISLDTSGDKTKEQLEVKSSYLLFGAVLSFISALVQAGFTFYHKENATITLVFLLSAFLIALRWLGAIYCNTTHRHLHVVRSDALFTILSLSGAGFIYYFNLVSILNIGFLLVGSAFLASLCLGLDFFSSLFASYRSFSIQVIRSGWDKQGKHSLLAVFTNEATINTHSYLIVFLFGTAAFAPIAAATLLFRPVMVVITSLTQVERPRARQIIKDMGLEYVQRSLSRFYSLNIIFYILNVIAVLILLTFLTEWFWKDEKSLNYLLYSVFIIAFSRLFRVLSCTYRVILQAADMFRALSYITAISALISVPVVVVLALYASPYMTLWGVVLGELISLFMLRSAFLKVLSGVFK